MARRPRLRSGDSVVVLAGKDRGKSGRILRVDIKKQRVFVEGANMVKRHQRPNPARPNIKVGVIEKEGPIHISNVALADPKDGKPTKVVIRRSPGQPGRVRFAKRSNTELEQ